jgi:cytidine deaminase
VLACCRVKTDKKGILKNMTQDKLIDVAKGILGEFTLSSDYFRAGNVASALISKKGNIYTGICIDVACGIGFCAEHAAIAELLKNRETEIEMIVAISKSNILPPCGRCRELMYQINHKNSNTKIVLPNNVISTPNELLPCRFQ